MQWCVVVVIVLCGASEQKIITELYRTDGRSSLDLFGWNSNGWNRNGVLKKTPTARMTCVFTFLTPSDLRVLEKNIARQGQVCAKKMA